MTSIVEESLKDSKYFQKNETLFTQGNGYLGIRGFFEESYLWQTRDTFVAGVYNNFGKNEVSELVNLPDVLLSILFIDRERVEIKKDSVTNYSRTMNLGNGELVRSFVWHHSDGSRYRLTFKRFISKRMLSLIAQHITVEALDREAEVNWTTLLDGRQTNSGVQHLYELDKRVFDDSMFASYETNESGIQVVLGSYLVNSFHQPFRYSTKRRQLIAETAGKVKLGSAVQFEKYTLVRTSKDTLAEELLIEIKEELWATSWQYESLLVESEEEWEKFWRQSRVVIEGGDKAVEHQQKMDWTLYHMEIMSPKHTSLLSIPAKGLTGEGYSGHIFWDTEMFILPFFLHTNPSVAKNLLKYRYYNLPEAKKHAKNNGYEGAQYPWESALNGKEETPELATINIRTGTRHPVASAIAEHHITAVIAYAIMNYWEATQDETFMKEMGIEMLEETARFWISRATEVNGRLEIHNVIGPDEYTEFVDNNAYTNYLAYYNVKSALTFIDKNHPFRVNAEDFLERLYLPVPNKEDIIPQDDTFLNLPNLNISTYKRQSGKQAILQDYSRQEVIERQVLKQADVVMLLYIFPHLFSKYISKTNLNYYEERTIHDSSLSKCVHSIVCVENGEQDKSERFFEQAIDIDFGEDPTTSLDGVHAAALGGNWLMVVQGFAGVRIKDGTLTLNPVLQSNWDNYSFPYIYKGIRVQITIKKNKLTIENLTGKALTIEVYGQKQEVQETLTLDINHFWRGA